MENGKKGCRSYERVAEKVAKERERVNKGEGSGASGKERKEERECGQLITVLGDRGGEEKKHKEW